MSIQKLLLALIFLYTLISPIIIEKANRVKKLSIWNVGQGQWVTLVNSDVGICIHSDFGGEKSPILNIQILCRDKENHVLLSHPDLDHRNYWKQLSTLPKVCIIKESFPPLEASKKRSHVMLLKSMKLLPTCPNNINDNQKILEPEKLLATNIRSTNSLSRILNFESLLTCGDSTKKEERFWIKKIKNPDNIKYLVLGHHGSKTSTSDQLLDSLTNIKMAIASARFRKYRHPHYEVVARLRNRKIPLLKTEVWGNIHIGLK